MERYIVPGAILLIILISIQYSLNKIIVLLKDIKRILTNQYNKDHE
ncbi:hypothetical protein [Alkaliphilus peptidifermentans]|uniref:Uncharacterized protein n=1 Tax=Alkaliphilus peptidifermentans DSM 18978 TaxID=1120976 RepID=A0A1G5K7M4_9FIRM|nr:hypothetical protein [Alkaliphilus peptidifermentans]SCY96623.1 hypothetical protein SAMN03080606_03290 [Alkaliphilus peptidifermentans DSM 18978]